MTADSFIDYLEHPSHLYQISYQELKSLVVQYPYCQNLRYLLLKKSQLENHQDLNRNLSLAATYAADRSRLFELSHQAIESEESIEFLDLQEVKNAPEREVVLVENASFDFVMEEGFDKAIIPQVPSDNIEQIPDHQEEEETTLELPLLDSFAAFENVQEEDVRPLSETETEVINLLFFDSFATNEWLSERLSNESETSLDEIDAEIAAAMERLAAQQNPDKDKTLETAIIEEEEEVNPPIIKVEKEIVAAIRPEPEVSFSSWLNQFKAPARRGEGKGYNVLLTPLELESPIQKRKKRKKKKKKTGGNALNQMLKTKQKALDKRKKKKKKKHKIVAKAVMSLVESEDLVSETLANILVEQERYKKAIKMYKRLGLKFPEKSAYFAAKIEKIKKLK